LLLNTDLPADLSDIDALETGLEGALYFADRSLSTAIFLALRLRRPLFLEGEPGVGKTEVAKVLSRLFDRRLIRLQCYEGLDVSSAVYEWDYSRQMLEIRLLEAEGKVGGKVSREEARRDLFSGEFLLKRPLLQAVTAEETGESSPVLLIDELDRADEEFEAFLLEVLSDFQVTVPEIGTLRAKEPPVVVITSNRTREIHDALRRRCLYHWIDYPVYDKELRIVEAKVPEAAEALADEVVRFVQELRGADLYKRPGVAETLDWLRALVALDRKTLTPETVEETLGVLLKYQDDIEQVRETGVERLLGHARAPG
jgi:MoxR-like ATPase